MIEEIAKGVGAVADIANTAMQAANQEYMKGVQKETWKREDTAVQRRMADLRAAGLSPTLAAGSAASTSSPINVGTPRLDSSNVMKGVEYGTARLQNALTQANKDLVDAQIDKVDAESFVPRMFRDEWQRRESSGRDFTMGPSGRDIISSMFDKMYSDNNLSILNSSIAQWNAGLAASQGLPVTEEQLNDVGNGQQFKNIFTKSDVPTVGWSKLLGIASKLVQMFK